MSRIDITKPRKGVLQEPVRILIYGPDKVGKSTLGSGMPEPIFWDPSGGTDRLDVARVPKANGGFQWQDLLDAVEQLSSVNHSFKTLVIDELGKTEQLAWDHVARANGKAFGELNKSYNRGFELALEEWRGLISRLERMRTAKGVNTLLIGHATVKTFRNPEGSDFDRYQIKLHDKIAGLLREWVDATLFARYEDLGTKDDKKVIGVSTGERVLHTEHRAAYDAGNRYSLPERLPLSWEKLDECISKGQRTTAELLKEMEIISAKLSDEHRKDAAAYVKKANGNTSLLSKAVEWARARQTT